MSGTRALLGFALVLATLTGWAVSVGVGQQQDEFAVPNRPRPELPDFEPPHSAPPPIEQLQPLFPVENPPQPHEQSPLPPVGVPEMESPSFEPAGRRSNLLRNAPTSSFPTAASTVRESPAVSLEWVLPSAAKVGQPSELQIVVKNISTAPVQQVVVRYRIPQGVAIDNTEPRAMTEGELLVWNMGTMQPNEERRITFALRAEARGEIPCQAWVTFTGSSTASLVVKEPQLVVRATGPEQVLMGDTVKFTLTVSNPGDGQADNVKLEATLSEGLESRRGRTVEMDIGSLAANETRTVELVCASRGDGQQRCEIVAVGEGNLIHHDQTAVMVVSPKLTLEAFGPKLRYLERPATFMFRASNPGDAPATNVTITDQIPHGFKYSNSSEGGRFDSTTKSVTWFLGELAPGETREVTLDVEAINAGDHQHKVSAIAARGLRSQAETTTRIEGLSAVLMELVDTEDPIEVGAETKYEIRITNTGSKTETNLQLICILPEKMECTGAQGVSGSRYRVEGQHVIFEPLPKLAPRADAVYRVEVRGLTAGDCRFRARITADGLSEPVLNEESTKVYSDDGIFPQ